jgi:hypothetical protein
LRIGSLAAWMALLETFRDAIAAAAAFTAAVAASAASVAALMAAIAAFMASTSRFMLLRISMCGAKARHGHFPASL